MLIQNLKFLLKESIPQDCTLVKVDSANKNGMLLEMVQVLTDLDLVISKSYISSDGGWLMDVFHVTDQQGNKLTDETLIYYVEEGICASRQASMKAKPINRQEVRPRHVLTGHMALEMTGVDRPGVLSEMTAVLAELGCHISAAAAWTHNNRAACIIYVDDDTTSSHAPTMDSSRVAQVQAQLEHVVEAHHQTNERRSVRLAAPAAVGGQTTHTERRLHQLMASDEDYQECSSCRRCDCEWDNLYAYYGRGCPDKGGNKECDATHVKIENCAENHYSIITIRCRDRPKLLYDTLCTLTDLQYIVYHAAISSHDSTAFQEYYVRHKDGGTLRGEGEKHRVLKCLIAATERRVSHGLRLEICTVDKATLLSDTTRVFRESGLSIARVEFGVRGEKAVGTFHVKDMSGDTVAPETVEMIRKEIGGSISVENIDSYSEALTPLTTSSCGGVVERPRFKLGGLLWAQLERLSGNFKAVRS
ncbi:ACT domain-containing protein ACR1-like isoform X2 [Andrographis paniculata]|uniref:ACT domain-containing protein ACR1-like isoform X2 n=1 Tax=Andrographis paniculata TaxID=175694 RepID=UPI0021E810B7|nr:ACT domain-containing protein ACR1-like isoform X2 [Andrographis paniculata]XP_051140577.1 ACT domain-containing protein ACR1-like isoform X2 [Andrographis paniculata]XP_051140578.1 ACT domain-containing protein ACR1-like isoform X2 [Andrographis paniculata]